MSVAHAGAALPLAEVRTLLIGGAGAYAGRLLAGMGATVVLVEPLQGCPERRQPPFAPGPLGSNSSLSFAFLAAGLRSLALDLTTMDGAAVLERALASASLCLDARAWDGPSPWTEAAGRPINATLGRIPVCRLGPEGELAGQGADDLLIQAAGGLMQISGYPEGEPTPAPGELGRMQTALVGATAALAALAQSERPGGSPAELFVGAQAAMTLTTVQTSNPGFYVWNGVVPVRGGLRGLGGPPYRCRDGWVTFTVPGERWPAFIRWLADEGVATDGLPSELDGRVESMLGALAAARPIVERLAEERTTQEFYHQAQRRGLLAMPVSSLSEVLTDSHLQARSFFVPDSRGAAELRSPFTSAPPMWDLRTEAPRLGEFTEEFLVGTLGYTRADLESLVAMGAVSCGL